jgi:4a-hydroxytetrahydrobiopterin dehydratase
MALRDEIIPAGELAARLAALGGWRGDTSGIRRDYQIAYDDAIRAVGQIGQVAVELEHRPDIDIRWDKLTIYLTTHTAGDVVTELDLVTAGRIDQLAERHGAGVHPERPARS